MFLSWEGGRQNKKQSQEDEVPHRENQSIKWARALSSLFGIFQHNVPPSDLPNLGHRKLQFPLCTDHLGASLVGSGVKNLPASAEDVGLISELGSSPGEGHDNPLQYSCLENSMDRGASWAKVHGVAKSWTMTQRLTLSLSHFYCLIF